MQLCQRDTQLFSVIEYLQFSSFIPRKTFKDLGLGASSYLLLIVVFLYLKKKKQSSPIQLSCPVWMVSYLVTHKSTERSWNVVATSIILHDLLTTKTLKDKWYLSLHYMNCVWMLQRCWSSIQIISKSVTWNRWCKLRMKNRKWHICSVIMIF